MRVAFYTLGCKLNQSESEALASAFRSQGFSVAGPGDAADLYIVNTCTVTSKAEQKARRMIRKYARSGGPAVLPPGSREPAVIVAGCYAQMDAGELAALGDNVVAVSREGKQRLLELPAFLAGVSDPAVLLSAVKQFFNDENDVGGISIDPIGESEIPIDAGSAAGPEALPAPGFGFFRPDYQYHTRAFLKIQDGCDNRCSFCRVRLARGPGVSLALPLVMERLALLEEAGHREVVLTGVNIAAWRDGGAGFPELLARLLAAGRKARLRLSSLEPDEITPGLTEILGEPGICPHFHIPVQSGSDRILRLMNRKSRRADIIRAAEDLKTRRPGAYLAADLIVGFPGEGPEDFRETYALMKDLEFAELHVFPFSPRRGTPGWDLGPRIPERVARERAGELRELSASLNRRYLESCLEGEFDFLLEEPAADPQGGAPGAPADGGRGGSWRGISENYLRLPVVFSPKTAGPVPGGALLGRPERGEIYPARVRRLPGGSPGGGAFFAAGAAPSV